jgi:hypothetical protein
MPEGAPEIPDTSFLATREYQDAQLALCRLWVRQGFQGIDPDLLAFADDEKQTLMNQYRVAITGEHPERFHLRFETHGRLLPSDQQRGMADLELQIIAEDRKREDWLLVIESTVRDALLRLLPVEERLCLLTGAFAAKLDEIIEHIKRSPLPPKGSFIAHLLPHASKLKALFTQMHADWSKP